MSTKTQKADIIRKEENYSVTVPMTEKEKSDITKIIDGKLRERWIAEETIRKSKEKLTSLNSELNQLSSELSEGIKTVDLNVEHHIFIKEKKRITMHKEQIVEEEKNLNTWETQIEIGDQVLDKSGKYITQADEPEEIEEEA